MQLQIKCNIYTVYDSNKLSFFKMQQFCGFSSLLWKLIGGIVIFNNIDE